VKIKKMILSLLLMFTILSTVVASSSIALADSTDNSQTIRTFNPSSITAFADGGEKYVYSIDGIDNVFPVPPSGFNPLTATAAQLEEYGFPPKPIDPTDLQNWTEIMKNYKETVTPGKISTTTKSVTSNTQSIKSMSSNWSGYTSNEISGSNQWVAVQGTFIQPSENTSGQHHSSDVDAWVGLGGVNTVRGLLRLVQAGTTTQILSGSGTSYPSSCYAWYEYLNQVPGSGTINQGINAQTISNSSFVISPNDSIYVYVSFETGNNRCDFYVLDNTTGESAQSYVLGMVSSSLFYDGSTAEWVNERSAPYLLDCNDVKWSNCKAFSAAQTWYNMESTSYGSVNMYDGSTYEMGPSTTPSNASFVNHRVPNAF
jgi:hypothetical protein